MRFSLDGKGILLHTTHECSIVRAWSHIESYFDIVSANKYHGNNCVLSYLESSMIRIMFSNVIYFLLTETETIAFINNDLYLLLLLLHMIRLK